MKKKSTAIGITVLSVANLINAADKPNIVFIISDQHQYEALGCYGSRIKTITGETPTPNIDKLASEGILFTNAYTASPLSAPARASLMTGTYPHKNTALKHKYNNTEPGHSRFPGILSDLPTIGQKFRENGYVTAAIGKMHVHGEMKEVNDLGFDYTDLRFYTYFPGAHYSDRANGEWNRRYREMPPYANKKYRDIDSVRFKNVNDKMTVNMNNNNVHFIQTLVEKEEQMFDYLVAEESIKFIEKYAKEKKPFFIHVGFEKPHEPYTVHQRYLDMFPPKDIILPKTWNLIDDIGQLPFHMSWMYQKNPDSIRAKNTIAGYFACIKSMDEQVGKVIKACKELGIYENTVFIYTSDHGDNMYNHSMLQKHCMLESAVKIPLVVVYPKAFPQNKVNKSLVSLLDLPATILQLSNITPPKTFDGMPLTDVVNNPKACERMIFSEFYEANGNYKMFPETNTLPMKMCRYKQYKYVYTHGFIEQLYDLKTDANELNNLVRSSFEKHKGIIEKMRLATLNDWKVDEFPLLNASMNREKDKLVFKITDITESNEYILYRSLSGNIADAKQIFRSQKGELYDFNPNMKQKSYYWIIAIPKLERTYSESKLYKNTPTATKLLPKNIPASMCMEVSKSILKMNYIYEPQNKYK